MSTIIEPRGIHRRTEFEVTESLRLRLMRGIQIVGPDECWPWLGAMRNGYGAIKAGNVVLGTHVVSYVVHNGPLPDGRIVTHDCDNGAGATRIAATLEVSRDAVKGVLHRGHWSHVAKPTQEEAEQIVRELS